MSANSHKRTSSGASEVQNRVYGKPPIPPYVRTRRLGGAEGRRIGAVTSGGYGPSLGAPLAMGYVDAGHAQAGAEVALVVRGTPRPARVAPMPFVPTRYHKA